MKKLYIIMLIGMILVSGIVVSNTLTANRKDALNKNMSYSAVKNSPVIDWVKTDLNEKMFQVRYCMDIDKTGNYSNGTEGSITYSIGVKTETHCYEFWTNESDKKLVEELVLNYSNIDFKREHETINPKYPISLKSGIGIGL